ncbi:hypothetical protein ACJIZ3_006439 [Penstemon smallii]|uniref:NAC domain-containing protein n=1 Tax=Penstemon smallii TaxID=265156 RepID=A0ABD3S7P1_9LAMI
MESTSSNSGSPHPHLPPGFRFHPTDEELVVHYLKKKLASAPLPVSIITEIDLYKYDPWELPSKASFGQQEWYFFTPRDRKYPNGARPNRAATSGYWKATGTDKPIHTANGTQKVGVKKALVFYGGKPPKGIKSNWIMHEYRMVENNSSTNKPPIVNNKGSLRLDDWVLCRIFKKSTPTSPSMDHSERNGSMDDMFVSMPSNGYQNIVPGMTKPTSLDSTVSFNEDHGNFYPDHQILLHGNSMPNSNSKSDFNKNTFQYWNGMQMNNGTILSSAKEWQAHDIEESKNNESTSFISLLNQNSQNSLVNSVEDGILYQNSHLQ